MERFDGLRPARLKVGIISAGRVGTALGVALQRADHVVMACSAISHASRRRAQRRLPDTPVLPPLDVAASAELLLLAVTDSELAGLVSGLAATSAVRPQTIVAHTSGANGIGILAPLAQQGCIPLAIHPAMTFTGSDEDISRLPDTCFGITAADDVGYAIGQSLVLEMGGEPFCVREDARILYHAALAHASNHIVTVLADALEALRAALSGGELLGQQTVDDQPGGIVERIGQLGIGGLLSADQYGRYPAGDHRVDSALPGAVAAENPDHHDRRFGQQVGQFQVRQPRGIRPPVVLAAGPGANQVGVGRRQQQNGRFRHQFFLPEQDSSGGVGPASFVATPRLQTCLHPRRLGFQPRLGIVWPPKPANGESRCRLCSPNWPPRPSARQSSAPNARPRTPRRPPRQSATRTASGRAR